jgi:hypothetical protein
MSGNRHSDSRDDARDKSHDDSHTAPDEHRLEARRAAESDQADEADAAAKHDTTLKSVPNPPRTTKGWFTAPKFGSASSGGGEIEPGPEKD